MFEVTVVDCMAYEWKQKIEGTNIQITKEGEVLFEHDRT